MKRFDDWAERLNRYLVAQQAAITPGLTVDWGNNDCCTFQAGAAEAMTGTDPMAPFRGRYKTAIGARRLIKREGGSLTAVLESVYGAPIPVAVAWQGDAGVHGDAVGVILGKRALFLSDGGFCFFPTLRLDAAFKVGRA